MDNITAVIICNFLNLIFILKLIFLKEQKLHNKTTNGCLREQFQQNKIKQSRMWSIPINGQNRKC